MKTEENLVDYKGRAKGAGSPGRNSLGRKMASIKNISQNINFVNFAKGSPDFL